MHWLYNLAIHIYTLVIRVVALFDHKAKQWIEGRKNLFEHLMNLPKDNRRWVWFHCASLGEFEQGRPVIEAFKIRYPQYRILITFFSPSGYEVRRNFIQADYVCYLPADTPFNAKRFLGIVQPALVVFVKYEFWINYILELTRLQIPLYLLSAIFRKEQFFFQWYGKWFMQQMSEINHFFVQDQESEQLLTSKGLTRVTVSGDTRFDRVLQIAKQQVSLPLIEKFSLDKVVIVAGSTWPEDESILAELYHHNPGKFKLIIAPHEIRESHLLAIEQLFKGQTIRYSNTEIAGMGEKSVMIIDSIGILSLLYRFGRFAYIGGGFGKGIHNVLEAAVYGIPVFFGPNHQKFREATDLILGGGAVGIGSGADLRNAFHLFLADLVLWQQSADFCGNYVAEKAGVTAKVMAVLDQELKTAGN